MHRSGTSLRTIRRVQLLSTNRSLPSSNRVSEVKAPHIPACQRSRAPSPARPGVGRASLPCKETAANPDVRMGPKAPRSTVLSAEEEAIIVALRKHTLLPLVDCLYALQATIPYLTRSSLHRCLKRHGISRLPEIAGDKTTRKPFKRYPIGYFHLDIAEVRTEEGKLYLFVEKEWERNGAALLHERDTFQARPKGERDRSCPKSPKKFSSAIAAPKRRDAWPTPPAVRLKGQISSLSSNAGCRSPAARSCGLSQDAREGMVTRQRAVEELATRSRQFHAIINSPVHVAWMCPRQFHFHSNSKDL
jgi:hypothetical protein